MNQTILSDYIWGVPPIPIDRPAANLRDIESVELPIETAIKMFLNSQIAHWNPDILLVIERKGTAIVRALIESNDPLQIGWEKVVSSKVISQLPKQRLLASRILVFDDMMKNGLHLKEALDLLAAAGVDISDPNKVRIAVFAVHEDSSRWNRIKGIYAPQAWYRCGLSTDDYTHLRADIVEMLQNSGSLMLDTEHLEVRVKIHGNFDRFVKALRRTAKACVFESAASRKNITVLYDDDAKHTLPLDEFPPGTKVIDIVKKCRVVQRRGNEFALIPICFPSVPSNQSWHCNREIATLLKVPFIKSEESTARFYGVGLRAALCVLHWTLKDLYAAAPDEFSISLPGSVAEDSTCNGYHLGHLQAMYPSLDIDYLNKWISKIEIEARSEGTHLQGKPFGPIESPLLTSQQLHERAIALLQIIMDSLDRRRIRQYWQTGEYNRKHPYGLNAAEIFEIGNSMGWDRMITSTLFDILIDEATLVTHVQDIRDQDGQKYDERTFEPDGEIVSESIRRFTTQWGLPNAIT